MTRAQNWYYRGQGSHRQKSRTFRSRIHWSAEYVILQWDKNKMAARTKKRSREPRQVPYKILNDLSSVVFFFFFFFLRRKKAKEKEL